jgi:hypothetical protein
LLGSRYWSAADFAFDLCTGELSPLRHAWLSLQRRHPAGDPGRSQCLGLKVSISRETLQFALYNVGQRVELDGSQFTARASGEIAFMAPPERA